ncbi:putative nucleotide-diphospho-sugar transferase [Caulobacter sp. NIBR2454]|uniref:putative nucleotide-diphospho-sugar transferase n=1 Tax=Caulobacter sp. NIBR2454 TaxID=3015996 RepID=UPI0022B5EBD2|nr:putative nucleotide-diphospho-sugar transferase [Caulobacter sp. NIBR2454]
MRIYAAIHDADHQIYPLEDIGRPPAWMKVKVILDELRRGKHEFIMWIDADACFVRGDRDILDLVQQDKDLYLVRQYVRISMVRPGGLFLFAERPNTGVMLIRNCAWSLELFEEIWDRTQYIGHYWWEQAAFMDLIGYHYEITGGRCENAFNEERLARIEWISGEWNAIPTLVAGQPDAMRANPIIIHFAGMPNDQRSLEMPSQVFGSVPLGQRVLAP